jgi:phage terminase large subunit-like protein
MNSIDEVQQRKPLDPADRAAKWISNLTLTEAYQGKPFQLRPWNEAIVRKLETRGLNGLKQYRKCLLLLPRKQAKTQLAAAYSVYHILGTKNVGEEAVVAASDRDQASHLFRKASTMIEADPYLDRQCRVYKASRVIEVKKSGNTLKVLSSDGRRQHGGNPSLVIIDELHTQKGRELYDALTSSFGARTEYLALFVSTQGNSRNSVLWDEYQYACKVRDGLVDDPEYLPIVYEAPLDADWTDERVWHQAMPALGDFCNLEFIRGEFRKAREQPSEESKFRQLYLNQLVASEAKWLNRLKWDKCGAFPVDFAALKGRKSYWGLDLSNTSDITALVGVFPFDDFYVILPYFWVPRGYATLRAKRDQVKYFDWERKGFLEFSDGDEIDYPYLERRIPELLKPFKVQMLNVDPHNATSTAQRLAAQGIPIQKCQQGWRTMSPAIKYLDVMISKGHIHHGNNPVLNWMADNTVVHRDRAQNFTFDKTASPDKIDGVVAMTMGLAEAMVSVKRSSVYSLRPMDVIT